MPLYQAEKMSLCCHAHSRQLEMPEPAKYLPLNICLHELEIVTKRDLHHVSGRDKRVGIPTHLWSSQVDY